jgi:hypothetical protein
MARQAAIGVRRTESAIPMLMPLCVTLAVYALLLVLGNQLLNDPDTYWHIAAGNWIAEHHAIPDSDPFSFTMRGASWISFEWLSQLAYAGAHALAGWTGVVTLTAAAIATAFGLLACFLLRTLRPMPALLLVLAALVLAAPHFLARPHALALPIAVLWIGTLVDRLDRNERPPFALLPLVTRWANLHPSFTLGIALIGPVALEALLRARPAERKPVALRWALFGVLALAAACFTPFGPGMFLAVYRIIALGGTLSIVGEWQPQNFAHFGSFEMVMLLGIGYALFSGLKLPPVRILVVLGLLHLALSQTRHADMLALLAPLFLAAPLSAQLYGKLRDERQTVSLAMTAAFVFALAAVTAALALPRNFEPAPRNTPSAAIAHANIGRTDRVLNDYDFGGYLIYSGIAPFIDGRNEVYGKEFNLRYNRALNLQDIPGFLHLLDEYKIDATLLAPGIPAVALLDRLPGWKRVYADDIAVVHRRQGETKRKR